MYILHKHPQHRRSWRTVLLLVLVLALIVAAAIAAKRMLHNDTVISPAPKATVTKVVDKRGAPKRFDQAAFSIDLPKDWEVFTPTGGIAPLPVMSWQNTANNVSETKGARSISLYLDAIPSTMAVNRILPVQPEGSRVGLAGDVSDGCDKFTNASDDAKRRGNVPAKWQGVSFLCDTGNYVRHVVGIGVPGSTATNSVPVTGTSGTKHQFFMTYTDATISSDDSVLSNAVQSLTFK